MPMNRKQLYILPYLLTGLFIFTYVTIRVFTIPVTIDEAWTLFSFVRHPVWDIITAKNPSTNNHVLNTLLTKLTTVFSEKEFFLRLPNLLSLPLYIYGSYLLSQLLIKNRLLAFAMFATMLTNYTLLDFFGLCRGYGLSIGLFTFSIAYLVKIAKDEAWPPNSHIHIVLLTATMSFYANIAVLHVMVAIIMLAALVLYKKRNGRSVAQSLRLPIIYTTVIALLGGVKLWKQYTQDEIFYGGEKNFIDDTMANLMQDYTGLDFFAEHHVWTMNLAVALLVLAVIIPVVLYRGAKGNLYLFIPVAILVFTILMTNIQFYLLAVPLPLNRIALFFYPLAVIALFVSLAMLYSYARPVALILGLPVAIFSIWRFSNEMNFDRMMLWWIDMQSRKVVNDISNDYRGSGKARVLATWPMDNAVNYYIGVYHNDVIKESPCCTRMGDIKSIDSFDYLYFRVWDDVSAWPHLVKVGAYHVDSSLVLYRNDGAGKKEPYN